MKFLHIIIALFFLAFPIYSLQLTTTINPGDSLIVDSNISLAEALKGNNIPGNIKQTLTIIDVYYYSFDGKLHKGQVVVNKILVNDIHQIFSIIKERKFPVEKVKPISTYGWDDDLSMKDNNTSAFNYRKVKGTKTLSAHALGKAIDINPLLNPQIKREKVFPAGAAYNPKRNGTITGNSFLVKEFKKRGWRWGGTWRSTKDYQHFEKK
ncbi:MAG: M15 family metallopeptidase [Ignavibacteriaceae bacterium]|nr:M15 family metallopeptidase [Ignavibacteriaceae bacterium]